ncbi:Uncharacterised protein g4079 [Pycnogonum litorale]
MTSSKTPSQQMDRSPSHDSVTTDLSLLSLSSLNSDRTKRTSQWSMNNSNRSSRLSAGEVEFASQPTVVLPAMRRSPTPHDGSLQQRQYRGSRNSLLQIPGEHHGRAANISPRSSSVKTVSQVIFEEESDLIRTCGALLSALGLSKSFSTSDICRMSENDGEPLRQSVSESNVNARLDIHQLGMSIGRPLDCASRSCSTWVAVGDAMSSTSQLPSPQAQHGSITDNVNFSAADFVRSVNKRVRQNYIRGRILSTYRVLQRLTQTSSPSSSVANVTQNNAPSLNVTKSPDVSKEHLAKILNNAPVDLEGLNFKSGKSHKPLSLRDVEKDKGKPLPKYERNMMIFSWLQNLDESSFS